MPHLERRGEGCSCRMKRINHVRPPLVTCFWCSLIVCIGLHTVLSPSRTLYDAPSTSTLWRLIDTSPLPLFPSPPLPCFCPLALLPFFEPVRSAATLPRPTCPTVLPLLTARLLGAHRHTATEGNGKWGRLSGNRRSVGVTETPSSDRRRSG
ncbi:hypothetical protein BDN71DRAFT_1173631 [Pleurotus eryngii]|uniref:Uncharacterized protein n=1 Tax=Pleurotus eryngii TaxID=5323 RepID=A0A9P5ZSM1_PLEER|nr:hypothetical protein BDN71DRAFT_1173631 [Pleurotus eryngii]